MEASFSAVLVLMIALVFWPLWDPSSFDRWGTHAVFIAICVSAAADLIKSRMADSDDDTDH